MSKSTRQANRKPMPGADAWLVVCRLCQWSTPCHSEELCWIWAGSHTAQHHADHYAQTRQLRRSIFTVGLNPGARYG